eukprot:SAG31_NODE_319_length_17776_cov_4.703570_7_plen_141_part_00
MTQAIGVSLFGVCEKPAAAAAAYCLVVGGGSLHSSGYAPNYSEVGGYSAGGLSAVGSVLANVPGAIGVGASLCLSPFADSSIVKFCFLIFAHVGPHIAAASVRRFTSWQPFFFGTAVLQVVAGLAYLGCSDVAKWDPNKT